jgi:hypothetical protein
MIMIISMNLARKQSQIIWLAPMLRVYGGPAIMRGRSIPMLFGALSDGIHDHLLDNPDDVAARQKEADATKESVTLCEAHKLSFEECEAKLSRLSACHAYPEVCEAAERDAALAKCNDKPTTVGVIMCRWGVK